MLLYILKNSCALKFTVKFLFSMVLLAKCGKTKARVSVNFWSGFVLRIYLKNQISKSFSVVGFLGVFLFVF